MLDADRRTRKELGHWLRAAGMRVIEAGALRDVPKLLKGVTVDCAVAGLRLDDVRDGGITRRLRTHLALSGVPVLLLGGPDHAESLAAELDDGASDFLYRPLNRKLFLAKIGSSVQRRHHGQMERAYQRRVEQLNEMLTARLRAHSGDLEAAHYQTVVAMSRLADSRDSDTGRHLDRIRAYTGIVARQMRAACPRHALSETFVSDVAAASPLHDIGKVALPDSILLKPGPLTPDERLMMQRHTLIGADILRAVHVLAPDNALMAMGITIAEYHHEWWNGTGYPHGLAAEAIPLEARIVAIADVYDALTSMRCYKDAISHEAALNVLVDERGTHFDPAVVDAFLACATELEAIRNLSTMLAA